MYTGRDDAALWHIGEPETALYSNSSTQIARPLAAMTMGEKKRDNEFVRRQNKLIRKITPWKILLCFTMIIFCAYQLFRWSATGTLLYVPRFGHEAQISFREEPWLFTFMAFIYSAGLLLAGYAAVLGLFAKRANE